jgi:hypothetical protein
MILFTKTSCAKAWERFWNDESGQGALEFAGWCAVAALLVFFTYLGITGQYNPVPVVENEFNSMYSRLNGI